MSEVDFTLAHSLNAVLGWLELGNTREARLELQVVRENHADDVNVLEIAWMLDAREEKWESALQTAESLLRVKPDCPSGWLHRAYAIRRTADGSLERAAEALRPAADRFPAEATIPFNLACYACQLGNLEEARRWLREAMRRGEDREIRRMALVDRDLEELWPEIRKW